MPCRAIQDGPVLVKSFDKMWSTGGWDGKSLQYSCLENLMTRLYIVTLLIIMQNARLDESQTGIKIAGSNINNFRYADDTTMLMTESEEELKSLLMRVKEISGKSWLKTQHSKN